MRKGELLGTLVELGAARVCEERQPEVEFTVSTTGGGNGGSVCGQARGGEVSSGVIAQWVAAWANSQPGRRCARTAATPLVGWRSGCEHVAHRERVRTAVRHGRPHGAQTGGW
jgi:hypothetical protein